jgi:hypothetical protein
MTKEGEILKHVKDLKHAGIADIVGGVVFIILAALIGGITLSCLVTEEDPILRGLLKASLGLDILVGIAGALICVAGAYTWYKVEKIDHLIRFRKGRREA